MIGRKFGFDYDTKRELLIKKLASIIDFVVVL